MVLDQAEILLVSFQNTPFLSYMGTVARLEEYLGQEMGW